MQVGDALCGLQTRSNAIAWNPMEAFNFTCASEDCSLYTYDMRKLKSAACIHKVRFFQAHLCRDHLMHLCSINIMMCQRRYGRLSQGMHHVLLMFEVQSLGDSHLGYLSLVLFLG